MKTSSQHITFAELLDLVDNTAVYDQRKELTAHLAGCTKCEDELQRLQQLLQTMRSDRDPDAPRDLSAYAINLFSQRESSTKRSVLRRVIAVVSFDSAANPTPAFGVRSGRAESRHLLYSAESNDIDLRLTREGDRWIVTGQVLGQDCAQGEVTLDGETESVSAAVNELCEFTLPAVLPGTYELVLRLATLEVAIPQIKISA
ncbi:MAG TPA: hypothetical protein VIF64_16615 [Pyrinomonadaceae bacterium]|jgi:hypothetical protein